MHATSRGPGPLPEGERAALWHVSCLGAASSCPAVNATKRGQNRRIEDGRTELKAAAKSVLLFRDKILAINANGASCVSDVRASDSGFQELPARLLDDGGISILARRIRWQNQAH